MPKFLTNLHVEYVDGNYWKLTEDLVYQSDRPEVGTITVPAGFYTDFASVPIIANWFIPKSGKYDPAAVVHDWLYFKKELPRAICDGVFCDAMKCLGVNYAEASVMYYALRAFGWIAWKYGKDKQNAALVKDQLKETSTIMTSMTPATPEAQAIEKAKTQ